MNPTDKTVTYRTKDGTLTGFVPGVGAIVDGLLKNAPDNLENANLEKIEEATIPQPAAPAVPAAPVVSQPVAPAPATPVISTPPAATNQETN